LTESAPPTHDAPLASLPPPPSDHSGAYIVKETQRAAEGSYENPIQAGIEATHANYDRCATLMLETAAKGARRNAVSPSQRLGGEGPWWPRRASRCHSRTANRRAFTCTMSSSITRTLCWRRHARGPQVLPQDVVFDEVDIETSKLLIVEKSKKIT
jgi:hypothetical protein